MNKTWSLVDLPGYGFAKAGKAVRDHFPKMISDYLTARTNLACVFVLIDSRHTPQQIDLEFVQWLMDAGTPMAMVFTKTDKTKANELKKNMGLFEARILESGRVMPAVFTSSSEQRTGRTELLEFIGTTLRAR